MKHWIFVFCSLLSFCGCLPTKPSSDRAQLDSSTPPESGIGTDCDHTVPPPPPDAADAGGMYDLVFAVTRTDFGAVSADAGEPSYKSIGFDLDNTCTGVASCVQPPPMPGVTLHDGVNGIDNAYGQLRSAGENPDWVGASAAAPETLLRVSNYSGDLDDDSVDVSLYVAVGLLPREDGGLGPYWDGRDRWTILKETLLTPGDGSAPSVEQPRNRADVAYVTGGILVARFSQALVSAGLPNAPTLLLPATQLTMQGTLTQVGDAGESWELKNLVMGFRTPVNGPAVFVFTGQYQVPLSGSFPDGGGPPLVFCQDKSLYDQLKVGLCNYLDVAADPQAPPSAPCDAISTGLLFQMSQALLGGVATGPFPPLATCDPNVHPEMDRCDTVLVDP